MRKKFIILACVVSLITIMLVLYFSSYSGDKEIMTLSPDEGDYKVKPRDPGGLVIPHSDSLVYDKLNSNRVKHNKVHIMPGPEEPMEIVRNAETRAKFLDSIDEILANIEYYESELLEDLPSDSDNLDYIMPNMLLTKDEQVSAPEKDEKIILIPGTKLKVAKALEDRYKTMQIRVVSEESKGYKIQLSSAYSLADAKKQWQQMQQKYFKILRDANLITKKVEGKNERIFYLVMAGTYPSLSQAKMICKKLSSRKQNCIVTK